MMSSVEANGRFAVQAEGLSLGFHVKRERAASVKEALVRKVLGKQSPGDYFWALQEISFAIEIGERFGLIGLNGSGKTTLLSLVAGIYPPDKGSIKVNGRVVGLLGLGAGFDPYLSGRENVFLNAALYGLSPLWILPISGNS
jgi:ABC-2 type transport system ATP-binding protein